MRSRNIFAYTDYSAFLKDVFDLKSHSGEMKAAAKYLCVSISKLSKAISGTQHLTPDQGFRLTKYLKLDPRESDYFVSLVQFSRCSDRDYRVFLGKKLEKMRVSSTPEQMTEPKGKLSQSQEAILHSSSQFLAVWLCSMVDDANDFTSIAKALQMEEGVVSNIAKFLESSGFVEIQGSRLKPAARKLEIVSHSGQLERFLSNWRMEGMHKLNGSESGNYFFSEPMAIGQDVYTQIKALLNELTANCQKLVKSQRSETVACLNIDFFKVTK